MAQASCWKSREQGVPGGQAAEEDLGPAGICCRGEWPQASVARPVGRQESASRAQARLDAVGTGVLPALGHSRPYCPDSERQVGALNLRAVPY